MEIKASAKYLRTSPRKLRLLTEGLAGLSAKKGLERLQLYPQIGSAFLEKLIRQAIANAVNNFKLEEENLRIKKIEVGEGPRFERLDKSHGARFDRGIITKKTAHIFLTLGTKPPFVTPSADFGRGKKERPKVVEKKEVKKVAKEGRISREKKVILKVEEG